MRGALRQGPLHPIAPPTPGPSVEQLRRELAALAGRRDFFSRRERERLTRELRRRGAP